MTPACVPPSNGSLRSLRDRGRVTKALRRLGLSRAYTLAELRRAYLRGRLIRSTAWGKTHELVVLNAYLVLKAALRGEPLPPSRTHWSRSPSPPAPGIVPMLAGAAEAGTPWCWRERRQWEWPMEVGR